MSKSYDVACAELARKFLANEGEGKVDEEEVEALAYAIQRTVEEWLNGRRSAKG